jgi:hypothetical protein
MKNSVKLALAAATFTALVGLTVPASAGFCFFGICIGEPGNGGNGEKGGGGGTRPVPGPLVGAGLPFIAVGYGAYWLVRRYRRKSDAA